MSTQELPILDCEEHSPYYTAKVVAAFRNRKGVFTIQTSLLDVGVTKRKLYPGDIINYKVHKKVIDGICVTEFVE